MADRKQTSRKSAAKSSALAGKEAGASASVQVLSSKVVYTSRVFNVTSDEVVEPSGVRVRRDIIRHPGSVVILALDERKAEPSVLLIRQYRYAANRELWEPGCPARIDRGDRVHGIGVETRSVLLRQSGISRRDHVHLRRARPAPRKSLPGGG